MILQLLQKKEQVNPSFENQLERIQFCNTYLLKPNDIAFINSLNRIQKQSKNTILTQKIQLERAGILNNQASKEIHPDYNTQAVKVLDSIISTNNFSIPYQRAIQKNKILFQNLF